MAAFTSQLGHLRQWNRSSFEDLPHVNAARASGRLLGDLQSVLLDSHGSKRACPVPSNTELGNHPSACA